MKTPLIIEATYHVPADKVWAVLTHKNQMKHWYFDIPDFVPEYGASFSFYAGPPEKQYLHLCKITEIIENEKIGYSWAFEGIPGSSHVTFELFAAGDHATRLVLTHDGLESFAAAQDPNLSRGSFEKGWQQILDVSLRNYLEH